MESRRDRHPYDPFVPPGARRIIIGSFPPRRFCGPEKALFPEDVEFYYGSRDNGFWPLVGELSGTDFPRNQDSRSVSVRQDFLRTRALAMTDIVESCTRINGLSSDRDLRDIGTRPLGRLLEAYPEIHTLLFTSTFVRRLCQGELEARVHPDQENPRQGVLVPGAKPEKSGREYRYVELYSPSPSALRGLGRNGAEKRRDQYARVFGF